MIRPANAPRLRIVRTRRDYNRWVANQTLEDYALRFTAKSARIWSPLRVANTALGSISFLALEAIGGTLTLFYGFGNVCVAVAAVTVLIFLVSLPICAAAARHGVDIDLLTRGAGFGYIGSTATSLIYATFTFLFFGIEAAILASMLDHVLMVPPWLAYILCALVIIPLVTHGVTFIARLQLFTQPVWLVLNLLPLLGLLMVHPGRLAGGAGCPRHRRVRVHHVRADQPDRGAGGFHPFHAAAAPSARCSLVGGAAAGRSGLGGA